MSAELATIPLGRVTDELSEDYHGRDAVSASRLRVLRRNPGGAQLYYQSFIAKTLPREETEAMRDGTALHMATLEPEKFAATYVAVPAGAPQRPTKAMLGAKKPSPESLARAAWWENFNAETAGKVVIDADSLALVQAVSAAIQAHPASAALLAQGVAETTFRINAGGLPHLPPLQCRPDWFNEAGCELSEGRPYVLDLKTCATLDRDDFGNFQRAVKDHAYHCQAALYMAILAECGCACRDFFFVAVEKCAPFGVEVYRLGDRALERGQLETERLLVKLDECYRRNVWPNTELGVKELKLSPRYYAARDHEEAV